MSAPAGGPSAGVGLLSLPGSIFRRVWRDASWSLLGNLLAVIAGLATLKIIGKLVSASDYGAASLVLGLCALLNQFIAGPLMTERIRLYFDHLRKGDTRPLARVLRGLLLKVSALILIIYLMAGAVFYWRGQTTYLVLALPAALLLFLQPQITIAQGQFEAHRNYKALSLVQPLLSVLQVPLLLGLLWAAVSGATSVVLSQALAAACIFLALQFRWRNTSSAVGSELAQPSMTAFAWSLYAFNLASWIMATSGRFLIDHFLAREDVGIYVINYAFWAIPYTVLNGWISSFSRPRIYARAADAAWERVLRAWMGSLAAGAGIAVAGTVLAYFIGRRLALLVLGERYWHSEQLMLLLAAAHVFFVIGHTSSTYFLAIKRPNWVWSTSLLAAAVNVAVNVLYLPRMGVQAAAWATLASYLSWSVMMLIGVAVWSRRLRATASPRTP